LSVTIWYTSMIDSPVPKKGNFSAGPLTQG
jgi:hypothetical protein